MKKILVTGAGGAASYNYIRSLRDNPERERYYIIGIDSNKYHLELAPVDKRYVVPPCTDKQYSSVVNAIICEEKIDFLHPQPDPEVFFIAEHGHEFSASVLLPQIATISICQDKLLLAEKLNDANIAVPYFFPVLDLDDLENKIITMLEDNDRIWLRARRGAGSKAALLIENFDQASSWIRYWKDMKNLDYTDFMVSEFLPGDEYAFQSFWLNGELIMSQARRRVEYLFGNLTVTGQSSSPSIAVTVQNDEVNALGYAAVKAVDRNATGIFCIDMKTNKNGRVMVTEINAGRFFTTSYFFSAAGFNMPYYYTKHGMNEPVEHNKKPFNNLSEGLFWVRMIDMGYKLLKEDELTSSALPHLGNM